MTWIIVIAAALVLLHQAGGFRVGHRCRRPRQRAAQPAFTSAARPFVYLMHSPGRPGQAVPLLSVLPRGRPPDPLSGAVRPGLQICHGVTPAVARELVARRSPPCPVRS